MPPKALVKGGATAQAWPAAAQAKAKAKAKATCPPGPRPGPPPPPPPDGPGDADDNMDGRPAADYIIQRAFRTGIRYAGMKMFADVLRVVKFRSDHGRRNAKLYARFDAQHASTGEDDLMQLQIAVAILTTMMEGFADHVP